jgi:hypothetical protein
MSFQNLRQAIRQIYNVHVAVVKNINVLEALSNITDEEGKIEDFNKFTHDGYADDYKTTSAYQVITATTGMLATLASRGVINFESVDATATNYAKAEFLLPYKTALHSVGYLSLMTIDLTQFLPDAEGLIPFFTRLDDQEGVKPDEYRIKAISAFKERMEQLHALVDSLTDSCE